MLDKKSTSTGIRSDVRNLGPIEDSNVISWGYRMFTARTHNATEQERQNDLYWDHHRNQIIRIYKERTPNGDRAVQLALFLDDSIKSAKGNTGK